MVPFARLLAALQEVPDPRRAQGKRYPLPYLLLFTVLAVLSGAGSYRGILTFLRQRRHLLNQTFKAELKRAPALNTVRTVLQSLRTEALEAAFRHHAEGLVAASDDSQRPTIALDGKVRRGSFDHLNDRKAAQGLMAFASSPAVLLAHSEVAEKSNEIPAAQQMIRDLGLTGVIFTVDALHCQKNF